MYQTISLRVPKIYAEALKLKSSIRKVSISDYIRGLIERDNDVSSSNLMLEPHPLTKYFGKYKVTPEILEFEQSLRDLRKQNWERPVEL